MSDRPGEARLAKPLPLRSQHLYPTDALQYCRLPSPSRLLSSLNASTATAVTNKTPSFFSRIEQPITDSDRANESDISRTIGEPTSGCDVAIGSSNSSRIYPEDLLPGAGEGNTCTMTPFPNNRRASVVAEECTHEVSPFHSRRPVLKKSTSIPQHRISGHEGNAKKRPRVDSVGMTQPANKRQTPQANLTSGRKHKSPHISSSPLVYQRPL